VNLFIAIATETTFDGDQNTAGTEMSICVIKTAMKMRIKYQKTS